MIPSAIKPVWSRFVRFEGKDGNIYAGEPVDADLDAGLATLPSSSSPILIKVLDSSSPLNIAAKFTGKIIQAKKILSPLTEEEVGTIRCVGINYHDHSDELDFDVPSVPTIFLKPSTCLQGPTTPIVIPSTITANLDFEVELAIVIGKPCKSVSVENALDYVLGYTVSNDVTARGVQFQTSQFCYAKGFDGFAPLGPVLVSTKQIPDPQILDVRAVLNGNVMQQSRTSNMIFSVAAIVSHISQGTTLKPGTVIITGTPGGIGHSRNPPVYLKEGDDLRIYISNGLGTLVNPIVNEKP